MSFGLKNARATYQRAIQTCLADHWGKRVEAYVGDVVIKTENSENFIEDLQLVGIIKSAWQKKTRKNSIHHPVRGFLLYLHVVWPQKR